MTEATIQSILCLNRNDITGTIPTELGQVINMTRRTLQDMLKCGNPSKFGQLTQLESLSLDKNGLVGRPSFSRVLLVRYLLPALGGGGGRYQHSKLQPQRTRDLPKGLSLGGERTVPYVVDYYYRRSKKSNPISTSFSFPPAGET